MNFFKLFKFLVPVMMMVDGEGGGAFMGGESEPAPSEGGGDPANEGGDVTYKYPSGLDESYHGNKTLMKYADKEGNFNQAEIAKALIHATSAIGSDKMIVPNKNFTEDQWRETFQKLGVPEKVEEYSLENKLGEKADEKLFNGFKEKAHELGVLPNQAQGIMDFFNEYSGEQVQAMDTNVQERIENDVKTLKSEWGEGYEKNMNLAEQALGHFFPDETERNALVNTGFLDTIEGTRFFKRLGESLSEDHFTPQASNGFGATPEELNDSISSTYRELNEMGRQHPQYAAKMKQYENLLAKRYGTQAVGPTSVGRV